MPPAQLQISAWLAYAGFALCGVMICQSSQAEPIRGSLDAQGNIVLIYTMPQRLNASWVGRRSNNGDFSFLPITPTESALADGRFEYQWKSKIPYQAGTRYEFFIQANSSENLHYAPGADNQSYYEFVALPAPRVTASAMARKALSCPMRNTL